MLKCDIKKFFASIDHETLIRILSGYIPDKNILRLLNEVISSFQTKPKTGLPLGNLTSQLLVNIYMNEFDRFMKHKLRVKHYIRYSDDFVVLSESKEWLENLVNPIRAFLSERLKLDLHPDKIFIKTLASGVDFLGWVHFTDHKVLRTVTKRRMLKRVRENPEPVMMSSYLGLLRHGNTNKVRMKILEQIF